MILIKLLKKEVRFYLYLNSAQKPQDHNTIEELHQKSKRKRERESNVKERERERENLGFRFPFFKLLF